MSFLTLSQSWDAGIYQLETTDPVLGGPDGIDNLQAKQLGNRTEYLKKHVDDLEAGNTVPPGIATQSWVNQLLEQLDWKQSVRAATTGSITLSGTQTIDGVSLNTGDRVLVKNQTNGTQNGIYVVSATAWTRSSDANTNGDISAMMTVSVAEGATQADTIWKLITNDAITIGTTALVFVDITNGYASLTNPAFTDGMTIGGAAKSAWQTGISVVEGVKGGAFVVDPNSGNTILTTNCYYSNSGWIRKSTGAAIYLRLASGTGALSVLYSPSGNAGDNLTSDFSTPLFSIDSSGAHVSASPAAGDNSLLLATTAFAQKMLNGLLSKSVAGNVDVALSATDAGNGILVLTGALTGNINVTVPAGTSRQWLVVNNTSGNYTVTFKPVGGTGVVVLQGSASEVYTDGTNCYFAVQHGATPAQFDASTRLATMAAVRQERGSLAGNSIYSASGTISAADVGKRVISSAAGITLNLPLLSAVPVGSIILVHAGAGGITLATSGTDAFLAGNQAPTTISIKDGSTAWMMAAPNNWVLESGDTLNAYSKWFDSVQAANGYQKLPSGTIIQWGQSATIPGSGSLTVSYNIQFPNAAFSVTATAAGLVSSPIGITAKNNASFTVDFTSTSDTATCLWMAVGN